MAKSLTCFYTALKPGDYRKLPSRFLSKLKKENMTRTRTSERIRIKKMTSYTSEHMPNRIH